MSSIVRFDCYEVDLIAGQLYKHGIKISLRDKSFQLLITLLEHPREIVTRDDLRRQLWPKDVFVDFDNNLNTAIARLREVLCDSADHPRFIETLPKRGYRFIGRLSPPAWNARHAHRIRLLVLPFVNLSGELQQEYLSDAITDEIITALASVAPEQLAVIARTTAMHYKGSRDDVTMISRQIGVDYVVEGGVHRTNNHVAVNVQLIQSSDQTHLFAKKFETTLRNLFSTENSMAGAIATHIPSIAERVRRKARLRVVQKAIIKPAAYNEYIQARHHMDKATAESFAVARFHLEKATAKDPKFAPAWDALAEICWFSGYLGFTPPRQAFSTGITYALRALEIDNSRAETHALLGQFHKTVEYNWPEVDREMKLALQLNPNSALVRMRYAASELMPHARLEEAASELKIALHLDPLSVMARFWLCVVLMLDRQYERAIEACQNLLRDEPAAFGAYFIMAGCYRYKKMFKEAIAAQRKAVGISGGAATMLGALGLALAEGGEISDARDTLRQLKAMANKAYVPPFSFVMVYIGLKEIDKAFEWLNRAVDECDQFTMPIKSYGFLDPIRSDPRFLELLRKMNLQSTFVDRDDPLTCRVSHWQSGN